MNSENQKTASSTISKITNNIDIAIHSKIDRTIPLIPSPTDGISIVGPVPL